MVSGASTAAGGDGAADMLDRGDPIRKNADRRLRVGDVFGVCAEVGDATGVVKGPGSSGATLHALGSSSRKSLQKPRSVCISRERLLVSTN